MISRPGIFEEKTTRGQGRSCEIKINCQLSCHLKLGSFPTLKGGTGCPKQEIRCNTAGRLVDPYEQLYVRKCLGIFSSDFQKDHPYLLFFAPNLFFVLVEKYILRLTEELFELYPATPHSKMATETQTKQPAKETFHLINDPADAINEAAIGLTEHNANLSYSSSHKIVYRSDLDTFRKDHVTTIGFAGGGQQVSQTPRLLLNLDVC